MDSSAEKKSFRQRALAVLQYIPGGALLFAIVPLVILGYFGWFYYGADHLDQAFYSIRAENLAVTAQPPWIKSNVAEEVFENGRLDRISLLDPQAGATIAQAFEAHTWVKSTTRVTKSAGGKVKVDIVYRRPAAMVYYRPPDSEQDAGGTSREDSGFFPVDDEGIFLPTSNFEESQVQEYFWIFADGARPAGDVGMPFGDSRVNEALILCGLLEPLRERFRLQFIYVDQDNASNSPSPWIMSLVTRDRYQIIWGHAPSSEAGGEPPANEKMARMVAWFETEQPHADEELSRLDLRFSPGTTPVSTR